MAKANDFKITIVNQSGLRIRVTKFEYKDGSKWKTENMFGLEGYDIIVEDGSRTYTRDLGGIGGERTCFRTTYKHDYGEHRGEKRTFTTNRFFARKENDSKTIRLPY